MQYVCLYLKGNFSWDFKNPDFVLIIRIGYKKGMTASTLSFANMLCHCYKFSSELFSAAKIINYFFTGLRKREKENRCVFAFISDVGITSVVNFQKIIYLLQT